ncbi:aminotransferase class IV [Kitasatospora sp. NBC_01539]|uniref:aminotransferase class IV n=1 Tax=Kitasatospora sp. NBC_01539 TaxID=2903577 RepID=UPI0038601650
MGKRIMWFDGACVPWEDARVHVWDELALRGANVFEGVTAFWDDAERQHRILAGEEHLERLFRSARTADIPAPASAEEVRAALAGVARELPGTDVYLRPTFYAARGRSTLAADSEGAMYIGGFPYAPSSPPLVRAVVSSHRRYGGPIGAGAKSGGSYLDFRVFERERLERGVEHVLILNDRGNVAEADGAAILLVGDGRVLVPSVDTGVLDSITKRIVLDLARGLGYAVSERGVLREELHGSQVLLVGTLMGLRPVDTVDGVPAGHGPGAACARALAEEYARLCRGEHALAKTYLTPLA